MAMAPTTARRLALGLLALPLLAVALLIVAPYRMIGEQRAELEALDVHIRRLEQRLATREQVLADLRQLERVATVDRRFLQGETPALAGAALQGVLAEFVEAAGGKLDSAQVMEPVGDERLTRIGVRLNGVIDLAGLREVLHRIETHEPLLAVERIAVRNNGRGGDGGLVQTELTVVGYTRSVAGGSTGAG